MLLASVQSTEDDCWKFKEQSDIMSWKDYQEHGQWYLFKEYIDPPTLMARKVVSAYDCGKMTVESKDKPNEFIVRPHFYRARFSYDEKHPELGEDQQKLWAGNATLTNGNMDVVDFPDFGPMDITIRFRIIASDNESYNILHVCGLTNIPEKLAGVPGGVTFQTLFLMTKNQPKR